MNSEQGCPSRHGSCPYLHEGLTRESNVIGVQTFQNMFPLNNFVEAAQLPPFVHMYNFPEMRNPASALCFLISYLI